MNRAREIASVEDPIPGRHPVTRTPDVPCYEDLRGAGKPRTADGIRKGLDAEFDKFTIWPDDESQQARRLGAGPDNAR